VEQRVQQKVVIDGKVLVKTDHFVLFLPERMTDIEKQTIADGIESFSRRFEELHGIPPARGVFLVYDDQSEYTRNDLDKFKQPGSVWAFHYKSHKGFLENFVEMYGDIAYKAYTLNSWLDSIHHELGHFAFYATIIPEVKLRWDTQAPYVGKPIPDFLDESIATLCQSVSGMSEKRQQFLKYYDGGFECLGLRGLFELDQYWGKVTNLSDMPMAPPEVEAEKIMKEMFYLYGQGFNLTEFLIERGGVTFFREMIQGLKAGHSIDQILADNNGKFGIPITLEGLERIWLDYNKQWQDARNLAKMMEASIKKE
jgi:hypothetical protein